MPDPVLAVQSSLTPRDHHLLEWLYDHGVLTTPQIARALFPSLDFAQERLARLLSLHVIDRFRPPRMTGGTYPYHYVIDRLGVEVVAAQRDQPAPKPAWVKYNRERWTASRNLPHRLGVNDFFTHLAAHARTHPDHQLTRWWPETRCAQTGAFARPGDPVTLHALTSPVHPDGHGIWTRATLLVPFFLEWDSGRENLTHLMRKLVGYAQLAAAGGPAWPVLLSLHSALRAHHVHQHLATTPIPVTVATLARDHTNATGLNPAEQVWQLHTHRGLLTLADLARAIPGLDPCTDDTDSPPWPGAHP